jgi:hypothetical protein
MKNSNDTVVDRTRYLLAYSAVLQPTALQRTPNALKEKYFFSYYFMY